MFEKWVNGVGSTYSMMLACASPVRARKVPIWTISTRFGLISYILQKKTFPGNPLGMGQSINRKLHEWK